MYIMSMQMVPKGSMLEDVEAGCQVDADVWQVSSGHASQAVGLTYDKVLIVDPATPITRAEYEKGSEN